MRKEARAEETIGRVQQQIQEMRQRVSLYSVGGYVCSGTLLNGHPSMADTYDYNGQTYRLFHTLPYVQNYSRTDTPLLRITDNKSIPIASVCL